MIRRLLPLALLVLLLPCLAQAVTRYVSTSGNDSFSCDDSRDIAKPKRNLRGMSGALRCIGPGDTLYIRAGTYIDHILSVAGGDPAETFILPSGGGSWATATTIAGYPGDARPVIQAVNDAHKGTIKLTDNVPHQWILINHIDFNGGGYAEAQFQGNNDQGILNNASQPFRGISHLRVTDAIFRNSFHTCVGGGGSDVQFINNEIHSCPTEAPGEGYAFYFPCIGCLWENNVIHDTAGYGIHEYETSMPAGLDNNIIRNNRFYNIGLSGNTSFAIIMAKGSNNQAYNNLIYNGQSGIQVGYECTSCKYYNNTIVNNTATGMEMRQDHGGDGFIRNNIVYNNHPNFYEGNNFSSGAYVRQNNLCNSTDSHCDHSGNPDFVDAGTGNLRLNAGSAARNQGISVSVSTAPGASLTPLNTSFYGVARPQGSTWDIGAAEYEEGGGTPVSGNPIYVAATGGTPTTDCTTAENQATPIRTITQGLTCMTVPGKTMFIKAGTYSEAIDTGAQPIVGGNGPSYSNATTIEGFGSDVVTIQLPVGGFLPLYLNNGANDKYMVFRKLIFDAAGRAFSNGIGFGAGGHHLRFEQVEVKNSVFEAVYVFNASNIELVQANIHDAGAVAVQLDGTLDGFLCQHCALYDSAGGLNWNNAGAKGNIVIRESILQNLSADALDAGTSTGAIVQNSIITDNTAGGVRVRAGASGMKVYNTTIANNGGVGLQCDTLASGVEFINDISWNNTGGNLVVNCGITPTTTTTTDPLFAVGTYQLADGSTAIDSGTNIPSLTVDYAGNARQQGQQDRGAYERLGVTPPVVPGPDVTTRPPALFQAEMFF